MRLTDFFLSVLKLVLKSRKLFEASRNFFVCMVLHFAIFGKVLDSVPQA